MRNSTLNAAAAFGAHAELARAASSRRQPGSYGIFSPMNKPDGREHFQLAMSRTITIVR